MESDIDGLLDTAGRLRRLRFDRGPEGCMTLNVGAGLNDSIVVVPYSGVDLGPLEVRLNAAIRPILDDAARCMETKALMELFGT